MTGWLRDHIRNYAAIVELLQQRKTELARRSAPTKNGEKPVVKTGQELELVAFNELQAALTKPNLLHHCDPNKRLYVDLDASKERGFGAMVYHIK
jgi:hypothetical protein